MLLTPEDFESERRECGRRWGVPWREIEVGADLVLIWTSVPLGPGREQLELELEAFDAGGGACR